MEFDLSTVSSQITADSLNLTEAEIRTTSGSFKANGITAGSFDFESVSGDAEIESLTLTEDFEFDATSGNVKINTIAARKAKCSSTSGSVEVTLDSVCDIEVDTINGGTTVNVGEEGATAEMSTTSGDPMCGGEKLDNGEKAVIGEGKSRIKVSSTSGSLTVSEKPGY